MTLFQSRGVFFLCLIDSLHAFGRAGLVEFTRKLLLPRQVLRVAWHTSSGSKFPLQFPTWETKCDRTRTQSILLLDGFYDRLGELVYRRLAFWSPWYHFGQALGEEAVNAPTSKLETADGPAW
jgi:hypothetical protein